MQLCIEYINYEGKYIPRACHLSFIGQKKIGRATAYCIFQKKEIARDYKTYKLAQEKIAYILII